MKNIILFLVISLSSIVLSGCGVNSGGCCADYTTVSYTPSSGCCGAGYW